MANWRKAVEKGTVLFYDGDNDQYLSNAPVAFIQDNGDGSFEIERIKATPKKLIKALEAFEAVYSEEAVVEENA